MLPRLLIPLFALAICFCSAPAQAAGFGAYEAHVAPADVFPGADRFGPVEGSPPASAAYKGGTLAGYVFETSDIGYSGKPIRLLVGLDTNGVITGAKVIEHHEPILLVGIPQEKLFAFVEHYAGHSIIEMVGKGATKAVDAVSGATVTSIVINDGLPRSALAIAKSRGIAGFAPVGVAGPEGSGTISVLADISFEPIDWPKLLGGGLVRRLHLSNADVDAAFKKIGVGSPEPYASAGEPDEEFIDLYLGLFSIETVGRSLLSEEDYRAITAWLAPGQAVIVIAANGDYSFRGSGFVRGGIFDRIQLVQDDKTTLFRDTDYRRLDGFAAQDSPRFKEIGLFRLPEAAKFNPAKPFRIELLVQRPIGPIEKAFTSFSLPYELPSKFVRTETAPPAAATPQGGQAQQTTTAPAADEAPAEPLWVKIWRSRALDVGILALSLVLLTLIFFFQDWLVKRPVLFERLRTAFLLFSIFWLGLYAKAQLSVVNVLTFTHSVVTGFHWEFFLLEPLIFMLWCAAAVSLLFWGRGAYCGWLCPFGALQEVLNHTARRFGVRQYSVPFAWHERLWSLKYILFLGLLGVSLGDMALAEELSEIEPFKTVVLLHLMREWPFVLFALALLGAGLFIERFYCRYLCVLGAALAIPGRGRMFDWLKRRKQCGYECQLCAKNCMVQAIHPLGQINPNECLYCMHCQVIYWDDHKCPPLVMKRERRGKKLPATASLQPPSEADETPTSVEPALN